MLTNQVKHVKIVHLLAPHSSRGRYIASYVMSYNIYVRDFGVFKKVVIRVVGIVPGVVVCRHGSYGPIVLESYLDVILAVLYCRSCVVVFAVKDKLDWSSKC